MKRTIDEALAALRTTISEWAAGKSSPNVQVLVYPPEWEAAMLLRIRNVVDAEANAGNKVELVDVGVLFTELVASRSELIQAREAEVASQTFLADLSALTARRLTTLLRQPLELPTLGRIFINVGAAATFVSFSAITNDASASATAPAVFAFPGESDEKGLNLLNLRSDTNYRTPRI